ncbi:MAG: tol-pal system YbgF family protein, partial [Acidimicrobiia bacterium]
AFYRGRVYATRAQLRALDQRWLAAVMDARRMRTAFNDALERHPGLTDADLWLGLYDVLIDRAPAAVKALGLLLLLPGGDEERGLRRLERAARGGGPFAPEAELYLTGIRYWAQNDPSAAIGALDRVARRFPQNGYLPALAAYGHLEAFGDAVGAYDELSRAIELAGDDQLLLWSSRFMRARAAFWAGLVAEALADLEELDGEPPDLLPDLPPQALVLRGQIEAQVGDGAAARRSLEQVLANPDWSRYHLHARSEGARPHDPLETEIFRANLEGQRLAASGQVAAARAALDSVLRGYPGNPQSRYHLAEIDLHSGHYAEAAEAFTSVAEQAPPTPTWLAPWAWVKAGWSHDALGQRRAAKAAYERARGYEGRYDEGAVRAVKRFLERPYRAQNRRQ